MNYPESLQLKQEIDFEGGKNLADILFDDFFPCVTGHAKLMDEYHNDPRSPYYNTVKNGKIKFHDQGDDDEDWIVKQCYLLLLAAITEADCGVENLWKKGHSGGRHEFADFGRYMSEHYFRAFQCCATLMFCDRKYWYEERRNKDWNDFLPCLESYNEKRKRLFMTVLVMLDESMSGWRPKTSKFGGLPNLTYKPRKPVPLGTQFKNAVECLSGCFVYQDVVQPAKLQQ